MDDCTLTKTDIRFLWLLRESFNRTSGRYFDTLDKLAERLGITRSALCKAINHAELRGHVRPDRVTGGGRGKANAYQPARWVQNSVRRDTVFDLETVPAETLFPAEKQCQNASETVSKNAGNSVSPDTPTCNTLYTFARQNGHSTADTLASDASRRSRVGSQKWLSKPDTLIAIKLGSEERRAAFQRSNPDDYQRLVALVQRDPDEAWHSRIFQTAQAHH